MKQFKKRRRVREKVLQILYAVELNIDSFQSITDENLEELIDEADRKFALSLTHSVLKHKEELDGRIQSRVNNWEMNRIALIDKILLRMGLCELYYFPEIPPKVSINEVIEIAKIYSTAASGKFINGILDAILIEGKETGEIKKTGRGLVDKSLPRSTGKN